MGRIATEAEQREHEAAAAVLVAFAEHVSKGNRQRGDSAENFEFNVACTAFDCLLAALSNRQYAIGKIDPIVIGVGYAFGMYCGQQTNETAHALVDLFADGHRDGVLAVKAMFEAKGRA